MSEKKRPNYTKEFKQDAIKLSLTWGPLQPFNPPGLINYQKPEHVSGRLQGCVSSTP